MQKVSSTEVAQNMGDCLSRVKYTGESLLICKNDSPFAVLSPIENPKRITLGELAKSWKPLEDDPAFANDLDSIIETRKTF